MNKAKILRASKALWRLENAQKSFNESVDDLSDEELKTWAKQNDVKLEQSKTKERIKELTDTSVQSVKEAEK
jgi:hypothetical protein